MGYEFPQPFAQNYTRLLKRLKLRGMRMRLWLYADGLKSLDCLQMLSFINVKE